MSRAGTGRPDPTRQNRVTWPLKSPATNSYLVKIKNYTSAVEIEILIENSSLQDACDTSMAGVTGCVKPREGYRSVSPLRISVSTGLKVLSLALFMGN